VERIKKEYGEMKDWDTSYVTNMSQLFRYYYKFNEPIGNWNTSKVTNISWLFSET
jgi:surface protein